jgi:hypothetical protein
MTRGVQTVTLEDLGAIGNLVGGLAVILSILYLARQVHQANHASIASTSGAVSAFFASQLMQIAEHRELCEVLIKQASGETLDAVESLQANLVLRSQLIAFENYHSQYRFGFLDEAGWGSRRAIVANILSSPGARAMWDASLAKEQHPAFARAVEEELARLPR